ncbi:DedA family protein [Nocardioides sp. zg-DK7169]|uniref:DedA family protein n=1 Tax=Nocardioides sp. zg-DK7169 TaxID=2736600 RepID=UPI0015536EA2|nr:DedA family protein [Nocardioides sp. zg-DK7169]NPC96950.1 DedA family protein [Nocardioides sp. zg-DK7169]
MSLALGAHTVLAAAGENPDDLGGVAGWAVDLMEKLGAPGAGLAIALENLFPPLPSEVILPLAGFTASRGTFGLTEAILWTIAGSVVGAVALYALGAVFGRARMYWVWERLPLVKTEDLERTEAWFGRHGRKAVFFGRMIPIFRSLISVPAGVERMPVGQFLLLTTAGSTIWNVTFVLAGYWLGEQWHRVEGVAGTFQKVVIVLVALAVCWWLVQRVRRTRASRTQP